MNHTRLYRLLAACIPLIVALGCASPGGGGRGGPTAAPPTNPNDNPTAGAIDRATRQAKATLDAQAAQSLIASQTAVAQAAVAATAGAAATGQARATLDAQATANLEAQATQSLIASQTAVAQAAVAATAEHTWPVRVHDTFSVDNPLGWTQNDYQSKYLKAHTALFIDKYFWQVFLDISDASDGSAYINVMPAKGPVVSNFYAAVNVNLFNTDDQDYAYGLTFRLKGQDFGFFGLTASGNYWLLVNHVPGVAQALHGPAPTMNKPAPRAINRIAVVGTGSDFIALVNDAAVAGFSAALAPGQIGLGVGSDTRPTGAGAGIAEFSDFEVRAP